MGSRSTTSLASVEFDHLRALLQETRVNSGVSQKGLSLMIGRPRTFMAKVEGGIRRLDVVELLEVLRALNVDPVDFMKELVVRCKTSDPPRSHA